MKTPKEVKARYVIKWSYRSDYDCYNEWKCAHSYEGGPEPAGGVFIPDDPSKPDGPGWGMIVEPTNAQWKIIKEERRAFWETVRTAEETP